MTNIALILVDLQNDFAEGGSLAVTGGIAVAERTADYVARNAGAYKVIVTSRDAHTKRTKDHFAGTGTDPDYTTTWPEHCMAGTYGGDFIDAIKATVATDVTAEFLKGQETAAYSSFEGTLSTDSSKTLAAYLDDNDIDEIHVLGLATDYCVKATAIDAVAFLRLYKGAGRKVVLLTDLIAAVNDETGAAAIDTMVAAGIELR